MVDSGRLATALGQRADERIDIDADGEAGDGQLAVEGADAAVLQNAAERRRPADSR